MELLSKNHLLFRLHLLHQRHHRHHLLRKMIYPLGFLEVDLLEVCYQRLVHMHIYNKLSYHLIHH
jgi:hypothetical protein